MLLRILTVLEEVKETQRVHSSMIQSALRHLSDQHELPELPSGVDLPLRSLEELDRFEEKASEKTFFDAMVIFLVLITECRFHLPTSTNGLIALSLIIGHMLQYCCHPIVCRFIRPVFH